MKICLITDTYPPFINGVSTSCYNLVQTLRAHGNDVLVVCPRTDDGPLKVEDGVVYVPGFELKKIYGYRLTNLFPKKAYEIIKKFKPDVIHNQTDFSLGIFARLISNKLHIPIVYTYHTSYEDYTYYITKGFLDRIAKRIVRSYSKGVSESCEEFITPSYKTKEHMRFTGSDVYINIIPTGIDFSTFDKKNIDMERMKEFKKKYQINNDTKVFLILGRVAKEKSMDVSIRGFKAFVDQNKDIDARLFIVGGGPQKEELEALVNDLGIASKTVFIGPVPASEVPFYYHLADIYTSASVTETQGLTFMEAMVSGAIVLARFDTNLENTIVDGESGFFFSSEDEFVAKAKRIIELNEIEKKTIQENALKICDIYSIEKFYNHIMEVYIRAEKKFW